MSYRVWLGLRVPSLLLTVAFIVSVLALSVIYTLGGVGVIPDLEQFSPVEPFGTLWRGFLDDPGTWSAVIAGGFSMIFARLIVASNKPLDKDLERMRPMQRRFGVKWGRILYSAMTLPYFGFAVVLLSVWVGFTLAGILLATFYTFHATQTVTTAVYSWLQQPPGATLYALRQIFVFGVASKSEKAKSRAEIQKALQRPVRLFGSFGPELRLSDKFYRRGVPLLVAISVALFTAFGLLLILGGFASGDSPATWKVWSVTIGAIAAGVFIGWFGCYVSSLIVWLNSFGRPRNRRELAEAWHGYNKAAFAAMMGSTLGPLSQGVGFAMAYLLASGQSETIHQGNYVFWGHLAGDLLSLIVVLAQARQMTTRSDATESDSTN